MLEMHLFQYPVLPKPLLWHPQHIVEQLEKGRMHLQIEIFLLYPQNDALQ